MSAPIPLRRDFDASQLRSLARRTNNGPQARRLLALAAIYDGATRTEAAKIGGVGLQIIRDWVLRFNARGPDALVNGKSPGHPSKLNELQRQAIADKSLGCADRSRLGCDRCHSPGLSRLGRKAPSRTENSAGAASLPLNR